MTSGLPAMAWSPTRNASATTLLRLGSPDRARAAIAGHPGPGAEVVPVDREGRRKPARREGRGAEERARLGDVLLLQETAGAPGADRVMEEEEEATGQGRGGQQEEKGRRIERPGLAIGEPRLSRTGERVPERKVPGPQPRRGVELQRIEEVALVPEGRRAVAEEGRQEPEEGREDRSDRRDPGAEPTAELHD